MLQKTKQTNKKKKKKQKKKKKKKKKKNNKKKQTIYVKEMPESRTTALIEQAQTPQTLHMKSQTHKQGITATEERSVGKLLQWVWGALKLVLLAQNLTCNTVPISKYMFLKKTRKKKKKKNKKKTERLCVIVAFPEYLIYVCW